MKEGLLPPWARQLVEQYRGGTINLFVVHGNVFDLVPLREPTGTRFVSLREFLTVALFPGRDGSIFYDQASGLSFSSNELALDVHQVADAVQTASTGKAGLGLPREPGRALPLVERYLRSRLQGKEARRLAIVIEHAQAIVPSGQGGALAQEEETCLITLLKWATDPLFLRSDVTIVLVAPGLVEVSPALVQHPYVGKVGIELPDERERLEFIQHHLGASPGTASRMASEALAGLTSGLSRVNILHMCEQALRNKRALDQGYVNAQKKELIEKECYGLLEFVEPRHTLEMVCGHDAAKQWLTEDASLVKAGKLDCLPMGYLVCGPVGTGKTFLIMCYTGTIGIPCVKLKNFRSQWQGVTEGNIEKILNVLRATGPVGVIIDEADAALGHRDQGGDSGTSSRVFGQIASQMGDTRWRGQIIWFLLTCRPDLLPVDLKRQGRAEVHIPLFYPHGQGEVRSFFQVMARKVGITLGADDLPPVPEGLSLSGADIEGILVRARRRAQLAGRSSPTRDDLGQELEAFIPSVHGPELELQVLAAIAECTDRRFLPGEHRDTDRTHVLIRLGELKRLID